MLTGANLGRQINFINGINGVSAGGNAIANLDANKRYHRNKLQCAAVNYTGGTGLAALKVVSTAGLGGIGTLAVSSFGIPGAVTAVSGGTGWVTGDIATLIDATGTGAQFTVTASGGALTALVYIANTATASPIDPGLLLPQEQLLVNGINIRDITPRFEMMIAQANGHNSRLGELPLFFTEPWRDIVGASEANSWDMAGQSTFQHKFQIAPGYQLATVVGTQEFDFGRNARPDGKGGQQYFLDPISHHTFTQPIVAGVTSINTLPFDFPILRIWFLGSTPGNITQIEIYQDQNKIAEMTLEQMKEAYQDYGFQFGQATFAVNTQTAQKPLALNPLNYFDAAYISDPDQRYWKALKCQNSLVVRVYSAVAQQLSMVMETLPGAYRA